jgi:leader peptidase (prepilin peptidase)/N-methyltransferase
MMMIYLIVFLVGLVFGSFLNVLIHRLPSGISLVKPVGSACPHCSHCIRWYENVPIFSYLFLKGKCSQCSKPISRIYPIVELITALVTLALYMNFWLGWELIAMTALFYTLIVLSFIDLKHRAVPDYLLIIAVVLAGLVGNLTNILIFVGGFVLLELAITFYIQNIKARLTKNEALETQRALGEGDMPIAGVIGGLLGVHLGISAIFLAALLALIPALYNLFAKKEIETAFIPFLSLGLLITFLTGFNLFSFATTF